MEPWYSPDGYGGDFDRFDFLNSNSSGAPAAYYSFRYGNVGFVALDANDVSYELPANLGYSGGAQVSWLNSTLAGFRADPRIDFVVVYFHHCAYCTCVGHDMDGAGDQYFVPAGGAGKSLYSFSAEHFYDGNEPSGAPTSVATYINEYDLTTGATSTTPINVTWSATRYTGYCLLVIDSVPGSFGGTSTLRVRGLDGGGNLLDYVERQR